jgi:hypothetical protein
MKSENTKSHETKNENSIEIDLEILGDIVYNDYIKNHKMPEEYDKGIYNDYVLYAFKAREAFTKYVNSKNGRTIYDKKTNVYNFDIDKATSVHGWTSIKIKPATKTMLETCLDQYNLNLPENCRYPTIDDMLFDFMREYYFYQLDNSFSVHDSFVREYYNYYETMRLTAIEISKKTEGKSSLGIDKATHALLCYIRDAEFFKNFDEAIIYMIYLISTPISMEHIYQYHQYAKQFYGNKEIDIKYPIKQINSEYWQECLDFKVDSEKQSKNKCYEYLVKYVMLKHIKNVTSK